MIIVNNCVSSQVVVDTGAPKKTRPVKPTSPPAKKTKVVAIETKAPEEAKKLKESVNLSKMEAKKENDARRVYEVQLAKEEDLIRRQVEKEREIEQKKKALKVNEVTQTDLDVGVTDSAQDVRILLILSIFELIYFVIVG